MNLAGVERDRAQRGGVLSAPDAWRPTEQVEVRIRAVRRLAHRSPTAARSPSTPGRPGGRAAPRCCFVRTLDEAGAFARIRFAEPLVLDVGDRFVLRESGRRETVAEDRPRPEPARRQAAPRRNGSTGARARRDDLPSLLVAEQGAVRGSDVAVLTGVAPEAIRTPGASGLVCRRACSVASGDDPRGARVVPRGRATRAGEDAARTRARIDASLARAHVSADRELAEAVLASLDADGVLERDGAHVRLPSRAPADAGEEGTPLD